jgi:hypothetical protein
MDGNPTSGSPALVTIAPYGTLEHHVLLEEPELGKELVGLDLESGWFATEVMLGQRGYFEGEEYALTVTAERRDAGLRS